MSAAIAAAATAALGGQNNRTRKTISTPDIGNTFVHRHEERSLLLGRYDSQKRRDWNTFRQYLRTHRPTLAVSRCSGAHVIEFLRYLDQFGKIKLHKNDCPLIGRSHCQLSCSCPLRQASASLDGLIGRLFAAYEENGGLPGRNPFGERSVRLYLVEVRESQAKGRGIVIP